MGITEKVNETVEGVIVYWIAAIILAAVTPSLYNTLSNTTTFPYGATTTLILQLVTLVLGVALLTNILKKDEPQVRFQ